jgi:hypothetical protein
VLPLVEAAGEQRYLTVLFCGLVGSTGISAHLDSNRRRSPTRTTPRSFKSSAVNFGSMSLPILLSRKAAS